MQSLWEELITLNIPLFQSHLSGYSIVEFERHASKWGEKFVAVNRQKYVTPYIHALMNHVGEFMKMHGSIIPFTQRT